MSIWDLRFCRRYGFSRLATEWQCQKFGIFELENICIILKSTTKTYSHNTPNSWMPHKLKAFKFQVAFVHRLHKIYIFIEERYSLYNIMIPLLRTRLESAYSLIWVPIKLAKRSGCFMIIRWPSSWFVYQWYHLCASMQTSIITTSFVYQLLVQISLSSTLPDNTMDLVFSFRRNYAD